MILPILIYIAQTWATTQNRKKITNNSKFYVKKFVSNKIKNQIKIQETFLKTKIKKIWVIIKQLEWEHTGYVIRESYVKLRK